MQFTCKIDMSEIILNGYNTNLQCVSELVFSKLVDWAS